MLGRPCYPISFCLNYATKPFIMPKPHFTASFFDKFILFQASVKYAFLCYCSVMKIQFCISCLYQKYHRPAWLKQATCHFCPLGVQNLHRFNSTLQNFLILEISRLDKITNFGSHDFHTHWKYVQCDTSFLKCSSDVVFIANYQQLT